MRGAFDYLLKPLELPALRTVVDRACTASRLMAVPVAPASELGRTRGPMYSSADAPPCSRCTKRLAALHRRT